MLGLLFVAGVRSGGCVGFGCAGWRLRRRVRRRADRTHSRSRSAARTHPCHKKQPEQPKPECRQDAPLPQKAARADEAGVPPARIPYRKRLSARRSACKAELRPPWGNPPCPCAPTAAPAADSPNRPKPPQTAPNRPKIALFAPTAAPKLHRPNTAPTPRQLPPVHAHGAPPLRSAAAVAPLPHVPHTP